MVDRYASSICNVQRNVQCDCAMDYGPAAQYENHEPHHTRPPPPDGCIPRLPITTVCYSPPFSPHLPYPWSSAQPAEYPFQPSRTTPFAQPQQTPRTGQARRSYSDINGARSSEDHISKSRQDDVATITSRRMATHAPYANHRHIHRRLQTGEWRCRLWMGHLPLQKPATPPTGERTMQPRQ